MSPIQVAQDEASLATGDAKAFTKRHDFFVAVSDELKHTYGMDVSWKTIGTDFGANITDPNHLEMDFTSSHQDRSMNVIRSAMTVLQRQFLPMYIAAERLPTSTASKLRQQPIQMSVYDPLFLPPKDITKVLTGFGIKAFLGLPLGIALAFLWEYLDQSIVDVQDVRNWMGAPALGVIPVGRPVRDR
jgi:hypothetical protein